MVEQRLRYLDGLRGFLALVVFLNHYLYLFHSDFIFGGTYAEYILPGISNDKIMAFSPINVLFNPGFAIHFFFILSGYVQSFHYFKKPDLILVQKSFIKRYFRLAVPTLAVVVTVFMFHKLHFFHKELIPFDAATEPWMKSMIPNNLKFFGVIKHGLVDVFVTNFRYYQVLWTMPIELMDSWMILVILFVTHNIKNKLKLFIIWILVQLFLLQSFYAVAFTFGMLLCYAENNYKSFVDFFSRPIIKLICFVVGIYFASYPFTGYENSTATGFYSPISFFEKYPHIISYLIGDVLLFCFLLRAEILKNILEKKVFQFFGNLSFMIYLFHLLILFSFSPWIYHKMEKSLSHATNLVFTGIFTFGIVTLLSLLFYEFFDKPVLRKCNAYLKKTFGV